MELRFAHTADYVAADASGKLTIVGVFDIVWSQIATRPISFPPFYLVAAFEASIAEGAEHPVEIRLVDDDEETLSTISGTLQLRAHGMGHPTRGHVLVGFGLGAVQVPAHGDYYYRFLVNGAVIGQTRVSVLPASAQS